MDEATRQYIDELIAEAKLTDPQQASILEARKAQIEAMPPEEQAQAIADLTEAYEPLRDDLRDELDKNYNMLMSESPQGQMAGNNQFSVYVGANPLEHLASGINKYQAGKGVRENRDELDALAKRQAKAQSDMMMAGVGGSAMGKALRNETPAQRAYREEQERLKRFGITRYT